MRSVTRLRALTFFGLLGAAAACATAADREAAPDPDNEIPLEQPDTGVMADGAADAALDADGGALDAGPCADSGLCIVPAPFDTRVSVMSISGSGPSDVWAVGSNRALLHYDGKVWERGEIEPDGGRSYTLRSVWAGSASDVWIADGIHVRHSTGWNGPNTTEWAAWMGASGDSNGIPTAISGVDGRVFIGRQVAAGVVHPLVTATGWDDAGMTDRELLAGTVFMGTSPNGVWSIATTRPDEAWGTKLGSERVGRIFLQAPDGGDPDAGASWMIEEHDSRTSKYLFGVWGNDEVVWLVGEGGTLRRMKRENVASRVFEIVPSPVTTTLRGVYGIATNDVWAVGDDATVVHWDGEAWTRVATPFDAATDKPTLVSVWGSGPKDVWIGGNGTMLHFQGTP